MQTYTEIRHGHLYCGLGGGAKGFNKARPTLGHRRARFRCVGGIDNDTAAIRDFTRAAGVQGTVLDLFDREQYRAFHGKEPPAGWREASTADIHAAFHYERPHIGFLSAPCKGFSGLLAEGKSLTDKYQALNRLTLRGIWLLLEAYKDDPIELLLFENVPLIRTRGRHLLDQIVSLLRSYGYAVAETTHDCGLIGGLAQSRKRFLLVARHMEKVPPFLYEPPKRNLRAVGDVLGRMPMPGDLRAGPMHRIPALQWKTWIRLAFVEAGSDWRSLNKLAVENGHLRDYLVLPEMHHGTLGVRHWHEPSGTVTGNGRPMTGSFSIADPRAAANALQYQQYGVLEWGEPSGAIIGVKSPGQGTFSVADPRPPERRVFSKYAVSNWEGRTGTVIAGDDSGAYAVADPRHGGPAKHNNEFRIVPWEQAGGAVTSAHGTGQCVADPRRDGPAFGKYAVTAYDQSAGTVISGSTTGQGAFAVADPRSEGGLTASAGDTTASPTRLDTSWEAALPKSNQQLVCRIQALDGTWHRPFTTLELAALQSLYDPDEHWSADPRTQAEIIRFDEASSAQALGVFKLDGESDQAWRERIGNAVPPDAATAIAEEMGRTLMLAWGGETFSLHDTPVWVRPIAMGLSVASAGQ
jgi:site-specific DNA-cytosine methylase